MALPIRTTIDDVEAISSYLAKKPTGAMLGDARKVLDSKYLDGRKLSAYRYWGIVEDEGGRMKLSPLGRSFAKSDQTSRPALLDSVIQQIAPYRAIVERAAHRREESFTATEVAAHWHQHFPGEVADSDKVLNDQAVCFFQLAQGAGLGSIVMGRRGLETRFQFNSSAVQSFVESADRSNKEEPQDIVEPPVPLIADVKHGSTSNSAVNPVMTEDRSKQAIFVAHGKNKKPLEQLKGILEQFKIPYRVATEEPNLGRPIGTKVREIMESCNCAILIFTCDEEFKDAKGNQVWRPSENVVYELGASGYLYGSRIVIVKESGVDFPSNFRDLGYISFEKDSLDAKAMDVLKELIGFGIVKDHNITVDSRRWVSLANDSACVPRQEKAPCYSHGAFIYVEPLSRRPSREAKSRSAARDLYRKKETATKISLDGRYLCRRRPTLPHTYACSTIGPAGLNFRVRDGNGCFPCGKITGFVDVGTDIAPLGSKRGLHAEPVTSNP